MADKESFQQVFDALKPIFEKYAAPLAIQIDKPGQYFLETKTAIQGRRLQFGGVKIGKAYVSFHLMPIYMNPKLQAAISPGLKKRMQGKSCFNFTHIDPIHLVELKKLTKAGFEEFKKWPKKFGESACGTASGAWTRYAGFIGTGNPRSSKSVDEIVYGPKD